MSTRYWNELNQSLSALPDVRTEVRKTRISYWRTDNTRFCKVEEHGGNTTLVLNELDFESVKPPLLHSEPDQDNRVRIRIVSKAMLELSIEFAKNAYHKVSGNPPSPSGD